MRRQTASQLTSTSSLSSAGTLSSSSVSAPMFALEESTSAVEGKLDEDAVNEKTRAYWAQFTPEQRQRKDRASIALLLLLYTLQGVPMGLSASIPLILQDKVKTYGEQAVFSLVTWPFSLKLLWAPIVDGLFLKRLGRRKTWLIPAQMLIGVTMLASSFRADELLEKPDVPSLTAIFLVIYTLCATQDIAVDGWALTMLSPGNVDKGSICNSIGQNLGYFVSYILFVTLHDPKTCNKYFRSVPSTEPMLTLAGFMTLFGWIFIVTTLGVWFFKREVETQITTVDQLGVLGTYKRLWQVIQLPSVLQLIIVLLTNRIAFACADNVSSLKLQEYGVPKADIAFLGPIMFPVALLVPTIVAHLSMPPMRLWLFTFPFRLVMALPALATVYYAQHYIATRTEHAEGDSPVTWLDLFLIAAISLVAVVASNIMFTTQMQFFCKLSDPLLGGTYMTLLNTVANLGSSWSATLSMSAVGWLETCRPDSPAGQCIKTRDGYYAVVLMSTFLGAVWYWYFKPRVLALEELPSSAWRP